MRPLPFSPEALAALLRTIRRHGDFYTQGSAAIAPPNLTVAGLGLLSLPFQQGQLAPLLERAALAPFGRGEQTIVDTAVRRTWQIDASALSFAGKNWQASLDAIVARAAEGLGVLEAVQAELYKLLVYDTGSFFVEHRDTEKAPGMFATLVLILPSVYSGGELLVRHAGRDVHLDLSGTDPGDAAFVAFYADCVHEVLPVTRGARLALVYNLVRSGGRPGLSAPQHGAETVAVVAMLRAWLAAQPSSEKLVYPLEHAYSLAELGFDTLKNVDAALAQVLAAAAAQVDCELHLAVLDIAESGSAEGGYGRRRYAGEDDDDDLDDSEYEICEVIDYDATLSAWRARDGSALALGALELRDDELCPPDAFDGAEPDESHFHEATGNEGASFDRAYRRAVLVIWPRGRRLAIIGAAPLASSLPYLDYLAGAWEARGAQPGASEWTDACVLAEGMVRNWPAPYAHDGREAAQLLACLVRLQHVALIDSYLVQVAASGRFGAEEAGTLADAALLLAPQRSATLIDAVLAANVNKNPAAAAILTGSCCRASEAMRMLLLEGVQRLADALLGRPTAIDAVALVAVLSALRDARMREPGDALVAHWMATCPLDAVLVVATRALVTASLGEYAPAMRLRAAVRARIDERIAQPLEAPRDWRRASRLVCTCAYCAQLAQFLADAGHQQWTLKAAETHRNHVQETIRRSHADVDCVTVREGRPHGLRCTKNQASHEARCRQRVADLALAAELAPKLATRE